LRRHYATWSTFHHCSSKIFSARSTCVVKICTDVSREHVVSVQNAVLFVRRFKLNRSVLWRCGTENGRRADTVPLEIFPYIPVKCDRYSSSKSLGRGECRCRTIVVVIVRLEVGVRSPAAETARRDRLVVGRERGLSCALKGFNKRECKIWYSSVS